MNPRQLRSAALACAAGAIGFLLFFGAAKHHPWLTRVAPFVEDPYDAVGSFAVQLACLAAGLSLLRAARRYGGDVVPAGQTLLIVRGVAVALGGGLAVALIEAVGEALPGSAGRALLVIGIFVGIEGAGILLGYALFWRLLGLVRAKPESATPARRQ